MKMYRNSLNQYNTAETDWYLNAVKNDNGEIITTSVSRFTNNYTPVVAETIYYLAGNLGESGNAHRIYYYTADKTWISRSPSFAYNVHTFQTPANCAYIQMQVTNSVTTTDDWMLVLGDTEKSFEPYNVKDWYGYTYKLRASGAWTAGTEKKRSGGAWT